MKTGHRFRWPELYQNLRVAVQAGPLQGVEVGGRPGTAVSYRLLGKTEGYGTLQFSEETTDALSEMVWQVNGRVRANNIFGEGASPKMRIIREGLDMLAPTDLATRARNSDLLLAHGSARVLYGVALASNVRDYLLGFDTQLDYLLPMDDAAATTARIGAWWAERLYADEKTLRQ
jgi:hypothetical protein